MIPKIRRTPSRRAAPKPNNALAPRGAPGLEHIAAEGAAETPADCAPHPSKLPWRAITPPLPPTHLARLNMAPREQFRGRSSPPAPVGSRRPGARGRKRAARARRRPAGQQGRLTSSAGVRVMARCDDTGQRAHLRRVRRPRRLPPGLRPQPQPDEPPTGGRKGARRRGLYESQDITLIQDHHSFVWLSKPISAHKQGARAPPKTICAAPPLTPARAGAWPRGRRAGRRSKSAPQGERPGAAQKKWLSQMAQPS